MGFARGAVTGVGVALLAVGLPALGLGLILRETGIFGLVLVAGGAYLSLEGLMILVESWWRSR